MADDERSLGCDILSIHEPKLESLEPPWLPLHCVMCGAR